MSLTGPNERRTWNKPMNTGSWTSTGRQPAMGLTPCSFCSRCISAACFCLSFAYFFRTFCSSGWNSCIFRIERTCVTNGLYRTARSVQMRKTTDSAQLMPPAKPPSPMRKLNA